MTDLRKSHRTISVELDYGASLQDGQVLQYNAAKDAFLPVEASISPVYAKTLVLDDEQIKVLPTTYPTLVPALGENKVIFPVMIYVTARITTPYGAIDETDNGYIQFKYIGGFSFALIGNAPDYNCPDMTTLLTTVGRQTLAVLPRANYEHRSPVTPNHFGPRSPLQGVDYSNMGVKIQGNNTSGEPDFNDVLFTGGDPANTLTVTMLYMKVDV